MVQLSKLI